MDTPRGNVYTFSQSSFWRFTRFCGKLGLIIWASWSTYVFVYHRPLLQKRTQQLEEIRATHDRHMTDLQTYLTKYTELARNLNVIDDKILNDPDLKQPDKEKLMNSRIKTWGELDFLRTRISEMFKNEDFAPEYTKMSELSLEYELTRAENEDLKKRNIQIMESMAEIASADSQIVKGYQFFKIYDEHQLEYVLVVNGGSEDSYTIGKIAVFQIQNLLVAYKERFDKDNFIKNLLLDNLLLVDIYNRAKKLHIDTEARRVIFIVEMRHEKDSSTLDNVR
jgi:hypothetical protein